MTKKGKKHRKLQVNMMPQEIKSDPGRPPKGKISVGASVGARSDAAGSSDQCRERSSEPNHRIFLSHSGAQKDFTWQLCEDLERVQHYPFFDRRDDSLPKGEKFPRLIIEAAKQCRVAVLVISDEFFTRSKWPMIELNEFVSAQRSNNQDLKILPLFLGITMEQFADKKRRSRWFKKWKEFACVDERIDVEAWKGTLSKILGGINAMEYIGGAEGEVAFRGRVVEAICKLLPSDVKYDVSHVQSLDHLCKPIKKKLEEVEVSSRFKVKVVGLYGMGGVGKTTISRAICNEMFGDYGGKVCHVEFGGKNEVELEKRVLREMTNASTSILENDPMMLDDLLKQRLHRQEVFLVLDNVWDDQVDEALKYLYAGHHVKSMVLVTSRSIGVLNRLGIEECNCMEMSNLEAEGAIDVLLHYSGMSRESIMDESEWEIVRRYVKMCCFSRGEESTWHSDEEWTYHPLALKALGGQLFTTKIKGWDEALKALDKFNTWKDQKHPVFSILRLGFDALDKKLQEIFLDLALLWKSKFLNEIDVSQVIWHYPIGKDFEWEWLCTLHSTNEGDMIANVKAIQRKGLLDQVNDITKLEYIIHDLYYEFAEAEAHVGPLNERRFLLDKDRSDIPQELKEYPANGTHWPYLKRLIIFKSGVKSLKRANLHHCKNVEVFVLASCTDLEEVDLTGMNNLRLVVVLMGLKLRKFLGLETLTNLVYFHGGYCRLDLDCTVHVGLAFDSPNLRVVRLMCPRQRLLARDLPQGLSRCQNLNEVVLHYFEFSFDSDDSNEIEGLVDVDLVKYLPTSVQKLCVPMMPNLGSSPIDAMAAFTNLQDLNLSGCEGIRDLRGLCKLTSLQKLDVASTGISELPRGLSKLKHLHYLDVSGCKSLTSIAGILHAKALRTFLAHACEELSKMPDDWSSLEQLEVLDLREASKICRLLENYEKIAVYPGSDRKLEVKVYGCWGLIGPLVKKLKGFEIPWDACEDGSNRGLGESMTQWVAAKKCVDAAAYNWLLGIFSAHTEHHPLHGSGYWTYMLDDGNEIYEVLIRALCEHDICGSRIERLASVLEEVKLYKEHHHECGDIVLWWVVVATAPCTFKIVTEGALMKPWRKTLLAYTLENILPQFLRRREVIINEKMVDTKEEVVEDQGDESSSWFLETWHYQAMVVVLQKCSEELGNAGQQGIDLVRNDEGKKVVNTFLHELGLAQSEKLHDESVLHVSVSAYEGFDWGHIFGFGYWKLQYNQLYPNFQFESTLAAQIVDCDTTDDEEMFAEH